MTGRQAAYGNANFALGEFFVGLCAHACASIRAELSRQELGWLLQPKEHVSILALRRTGIIVSRVRLLAGLFAILTPLWIVIDVATFPPEIWHGLAAARVGATAAFAAILLSLRRMESLAHAHRALGLLLAVPTVFFVFSYHHMAQFELHGVQAAFKAGYDLLPYVMVAGLSMFPLTVAESVLFAIPMLLAHVAASSLHWPAVDWPIVAATFWLLLLISAVSTLAGLSQLAFMIVLVRNAIRDRMTSCFSRSSGEELLELQFIMASRIGAPLSLAFIDLDYFKQVNDGFGHDAGDRVLANAAGQARTHLRTGDILVRWGGDEFILIMPNVDAQQACNALRRLHRGGFGQRPDGTPVTASIGIAERLADGADGWRQLVEKADARVYQAKQAGRDRVVGCG